MYFHCFSIVITSDNDTDSNNRLYFFKVDVLKTNADMILGG